MKVLLYKRALIAMTLVLFALFLFGCKEETTTTATVIEADAIIPAINHPDVVFYSDGEIDITYGDIYREFKINDGVNQLLIMVDSVLLSDYIELITETEITDKRNELTYGMTDPALIAELDVEEKAQLEENYEESLLLSGYGDDDEPFIKLLIAKDKYATAMMKAEDNSEESWYVGPSSVAEYYEAAYDNTIKAIKIKFTSESDAKEVMRSLNLVGRSGGLLYRYTGVKPIAEVPSSGFNDTNTVLLEDDELIEAFIEMYNAVYGVYRTPLDPLDSYEDLLQNPDLMIEYSTLKQASTSLANLMFTTFDTYSEYLAGTASSTYFTNNPVKYYSANDTSYYMLINLEKPVKTDVSAFAGTKTELESLIGQDVYQEIEELLIETNLSLSTFTTQRLIELRKEHEFHIYDYYLGMDYMMIDVEYEPDTVGHAINLAAYDDTIITAEAFFTYQMSQNAALSLLYASQLPYLINEHYADLYCFGESTCEFDIDLNTSAKMEQHRADLLERKAAFLESSYVDYYTFEEYVYIGFGATSETELIELYYIKSALQPVEIYNMIKADDWKLLEEFLQTELEKVYDNYFSLNVNHLLIYVDRNEDGVPDDYQEFVASEADEVAYEALISAFETAIIDYLDESEDNTFQTLIAAYNRAKRNDETWGEFKNYGFYLMKEDLSSSESLTYANSKDVYAQPFVEGMIAAYQEYQLEANIDEAKLLYETYIETVYGRHLIEVTKGTAFAMPSAAFSMTYDDEENPEYSLGTVNTSERLNLDQLKVFAEYRYYEMIFGADDELMEAMGVTMPLIPQKVKTALTTFFQDIYDAVYVIGTINTNMAQRLAGGAVVDSNAYYTDLDTEDIAAQLLQLKDIYFDQVFPDYIPN